MDDRWFRFESRKSLRSNDVSYHVFFLVVIGLANHCNQEERITFYSRKIIDCAIQIDPNQIAGQNWTFANAKYMANRLRHATKIVQIKIIFHIDCFTHFIGIYCNLTWTQDMAAFQQQSYKIKRNTSIRVCARFNTLKWNALHGHWKLYAVIGFLSSRDECQFKSFAI